MKSRLASLRQSWRSAPPPDQPSDDLLAVRDIFKYFPFGPSVPWAKKRTVRAVDGVSFRIAQQETLGLVGESGCGKTTTARMILGLLAPDAGEIRFLGSEIGRRGPAQRRGRGRIQAVFQDPWSSLDPRMRVGDAIAEPLVVNTRLRGQELRDRIAGLLEAVGLGPGAARNYPHEFSGGQRQRIAIARALSLNPDLIVLDEPVSALDVSIRAQIMNLLKDLQKEMQLSYLLIAHDLATVRYLTDTVGVMYLGKLAELAPTTGLFTRPAHPYTLALIDAASAEVRGRPPIVLRGDIPSPADPPSGCRFHTRCWLYEQLDRPEICRTEQPPMTEVLPNHASACHFASDAMQPPTGAAVARTSPSAAGPAAAAPVVGPGTAGAVLPVATSTPHAPADRMRPLGSEARPGGG